MRPPIDTAPIRSESVLPAAPLPVLRLPPTPRRKARPRTPTGSPDPIAPVSNVQSDDAEKQPHHEGKTDHIQKNNDPAHTEMETEPASSTANQSTDDGLDLATDAASDKDCPTGEAVEKKKDNPIGESDEEREKEVVPSCIDVDELPSPPPVVDVVMLEQAPRPIFRLDSDLSSDEEEDYRLHYRRVFRRKTSADEDREKELLDEISSKRGKMNRRSKREEKSLKRKGWTKDKYRQDDRPRFHCAKALTAVLLEVSPDELDCDIVGMFAIEPENEVESDEVASKEGQLLGMKRKRSAEVSNGDLERSLKRHATTPKAPKKQVKVMATRGKATGTKKTGNGRTGVAKKKIGGTTGQTNLSVSKMFRKHAEKKGWSECIRCGVAVWPPNINKHFVACPKESA